MKHTKKFKKITCITLLSLLGIIISIFLYFKLIGFIVYDKTIRNEFVNEIKSSPVLPERFYVIYNKIYPQSINGNQWIYLIRRTLFKKGNNECPCRLASFESKRPWHENTNVSLYTSHIENFVSQKECLNYYANQKNINQISEKLFNKGLFALNDNEIIELILVMEHPSFSRIDM